MVVDFIDLMRKQGIAVALTCGALGGVGIYYSHRAYRGAKARGPCDRSISDKAVVAALKATRTRGEDGRVPPQSLYGAEKMWRYLRREGFLDLARRGGTFDEKPGNARHGSWYWCSYHQIESESPKS